MWARDQRSCSQSQDPLRPSEQVACGGVVLVSDSACFIRTASGPRHARECASSPSVREKRWRPPLQLLAAAMPIALGRAFELPASPSIAGTQGASPSGCGPVRKHSSYDDRSLLPGYGDRSSNPAGGSAIDISASWSFLAVERTKFKPRMIGE